MFGTLVRGVLSRQGGSLGQLARLTANAGAYRGAASGATALARDPRFDELTADDVAYFRGVVGDHGVVTDADALEPYNTDWLGKYRGASRLVLRPSSTDQVSRLLARCNARRLAVVPQGGNTGLVGGSVPAFDEVVLSLGAMNKVLSFDDVSGVLVAEAGCVLQSLDEYCGERGFTMPLDLGAKGSCQIGGNVSTNAGGLRLLRYGSLHGSVLGLEAVLADGTVLDLASTLRKDNTGYDLKQLFIGAEGTLGVVTAVSIQCAPKPASVQLAFLSCPSFDAVRRVLLLAKRRLGEILSACEFLDAASMQTAVEHLPGATNPLADSQSTNSSSSNSSSEEGAAPFYMLIETHGSKADHDAQKLEEFLEAAMEEGAVDGGTIAASEAQAAGIWRVREGVTEALARRGHVFKYDLSIPLPHMYSLVSEMRSRVADLPGVRVVGYGHCGDSNLHLNISAPRSSSSSGSGGGGSGSGGGGGKGDDLASVVLDRIEPFVYEWTAARGGSISAEHGLGLMKAGCIGYSKPQAAVALMGRIKALFDPRGILNPYKVLPPGAVPASGA